MRILLASLILMLACACHGPAPENPSLSRLIGSYTGTLDGHLFILRINYVSYGIVSGYISSRGERRSVNGMVHQDGPHIQLDLKETGGVPYLLTTDDSLQKLTGTAQRSAISLNRGDKDKCWYEQTWRSVEGFRGNITFEQDGNCIYVMDSVMDKRTNGPNLDTRIRGTYIREDKDTVLIDWEGNGFIPAQPMAFRQNKDGTIACKDWAFQPVIQVDLTLNPPAY